MQKGLRGEAGHEHARRFFATLGEPQNRVAAVHIVGTAGKGTIAHLLTTRLVDRGHTVATHMSPHVDDPRERFMVNGQFPDWESVLTAAREVDHGAEAVRHSTGRSPSYFAITAAMSWVLGRAAATDFLVVEAGIGGRFDATNLITRSDRILVVSAIGVDHVDVLGSTVADIATAKVAAARGCARVVLAPQPHPEATATVVREVERLGVGLVEVATADGCDWRIEADSVAAATEALLIGGSVSKPTLRPLPPGRLERVSTNGREFILDGAHNKMKLSGLLGALTRDLGRPPDCAIAAVGRGKDLSECAVAISKLAPVVVATEFNTAADSPNGSPASWPAAELAGAVAEVAPWVSTLIANTPAEAVASALRATDPGAEIAVTGSFLYLGEMRAALAAASHPGVS